MKCKKHPEYNPKEDGNRFNNDCSICEGLYYDSNYVGYFSGEFGNIDNANVVVGPLNSSERGLLRFKLGYDYHFDEGRVKMFNVKENYVYIETKNTKGLIKLLKEEGLSGKIKEKKFVEVGH